MSYLSRTFGVEIEMLARASFYEVAEALSAAGIPASYEGYTHRVMRGWKVVTDGSLHSQAGYTAMELVSPILEGEAGFEAVSRVCAVLERFGAKVNRSCGLHVHVGVRNESVESLKNLFRFFAEYEEIIDSVMPLSRRGNGNQFCRSVRNYRASVLNSATNVNGIVSAAGGNKYVKLNFLPYLRQYTVEFRHHSGSVQAEKINSWAKACLRMVEKASRGVAPRPMALVSSEAPAGQTPRFYRLYGLLARPEGVSRNEARLFLNRNTAPPLARIFGNAGVAFEVRRGRYYLANGPVASAPAPSGNVISLAGWMEALEMSEAEKTYWRTRQSLMSSSASEAA